jgi:hypothetical protein
MALKLNGPILSALFSLAARYIEKHGEQIADMIMEKLWSLISDNAPPQTVSAGEPNEAVLAFSAEAEELIAA